jgi:hypothetical protein
MGHTLSPHLNLRMPLLTIPRHLDIVLEHQSRQYHLNLVRREEPTWTSMFPVSKAQVRFVCCDELVARDICCFPAGPQFLRAETVEGGGGRVELAVEVDGCGGHFDDYAGGDVLAVGEGNSF